MYQALLLAAGIGSRLRPLTDVLPKCLMPVNGRPLLEFWLHLLKEGEVKNVLVNTHHHAPMVQTFLAGYQYPGNLAVVYEPELLGTGGTLLANRDFFSANGNGPILVAHADNLTIFDVNAFADAHQRRPSGTDITMMTFTTPVPRSCGIVQLDGEGIVQQFFEKAPNPPGNLANAAVYIIEPNVFEFLAAKRKCFIDLSTEVLPHYLGRINTYHNTSYHRDIGTISSFLAAQIDFQWSQIVQGSPANDSWRSLLSDGRNRVFADFQGVLEGVLANVRPF